MAPPTNKYKVIQEDNLEAFQHKINAAFTESEMTIVSSPQLTFGPNGNPIYIAVVQAPS